MRTRLPLLISAALLLAACGSTQPQAGAAPPAPVTVENPIVTTFDGGLHVLDGTTLAIARTITLPGFNRVNPAGDARHVLVSTATGFRVLDAASATLKADEFKGAKPGHVVRHAGRTVLFSDGTGQVTSFDPAALSEGLPQGETYTAAAPHHGVAIELANGELVVTVGTEESRSGVLVLDQARKEIARSEQCPGVHGEATARGEAVVIGCEDGVLLYKGGTITKIASPDAYGRIGNQAGSEESPIVLGDYKKDKDAELERPELFSLINTETGKLTVVPVGHSYTFRSLGRGPGGEALILGTDGALHVYDEESGKQLSSVKVMEPWTEPLEWQQPRPALFVRGGTAYVSEPAGRKLHAVDLATGKVTASVALPEAPNEVSGVSGH
ncbi:zinc metallochaperone AztD [Nonomuraea sp. NPDC050663]|uniref:zinc metallochaperone AztD n=1 Tax=Nonomuraea sp. NPDC050663 TaxID=3364370 RepID=UPI003789C11F